MQSILHLLVIITFESVYVGLLCNISLISVEHFFLILFIFIIYIFTILQTDLQRR